MPPEGKLSGGRRTSKAELEGDPVDCEEIMPILGMEMPDDLVRKTRLALELRLEQSAHPSLLACRQLGKLVLRRTPYTGDYLLLSWSSVTGFDPIAKFGILPMPGCKGICVFHHVEVFPNHRGLGLGTELLNVRHAAAYAAGYRMAFATVRKDNMAERHILERENWKEQSIFTNARTNHEVVVYAREL